MKVALMIETAHARAPKEVLVESLGDAMKVVGNALSRGAAQGTVHISSGSYADIAVEFQLAYVDDDISSGQAFQVLRSNQTGVICEPVSGGSLLCGRSHGIEHPLGQLDCVEPLGHVEMYGTSHRTYTGAEFGNVKKVPFVTSVVEQNMPTQPEPPEPETDPGTDEV